MSGAQPQATPFKTLEAINAERDDLGEAPLQAISSIGVKNSESLKTESLKTETPKHELDRTEAGSSELRASELKASELKASELKASEAKTLEAKTLEEEAEIKEIQQALSLLVTGDFHRRWDSAKQFIKRFQSDRPIPYLIQALQDSFDPEHQWFLIRILGQYDQPAVVERLASFLVSTREAELQAEAIRALTQLGNSAIATLSQQLQSNHLSQRRLAARALAQIRRSDVITPLLSIARDADAQLRLIAVEALGSFHDPSITPVLISALSDEDEITTEAIRALGRRADLLIEYDLVKLLANCLTERAEPVAKESAIALGRLGTESAAATLGTFLMQPAPTSVKVAAVRALSWLNKAIATVHLATAFDYAPPVVMPTLKQEIAKALGQSRTPKNKVVAAKPLVRWLQQCVDLESADCNSVENISESFLLKQTVISSITWLGATEAVESLIPLLADDDVRIQMHALSALKHVDPKNAKASVMKYIKKPGLSTSIKSALFGHLAAWQ